MSQLFASGGQSFGVVLPISNFTTVTKISFIISFFQICLFMYLFLVVLGLRCYKRALSSCGEQGLLFTAGHCLLLAVVSLVVEHGL